MITVGVNFYTRPLAVNKKSRNSDLKCGKNICAGHRLQN